MTSPGPAVILLIGVVSWLTVGCADLEKETARQRTIEVLLLERAGHLDRSDRQMVAESLVRAEADYSVDALLLMAIVEYESRFRLRVRSPKGARGLMQVRPATAGEVAARRGIAYRRAEDLYDPAVNLAIGAAYLEELKESFGSWELALIAYHRGPKNLRKARAQGGPIRSRYASEVMERYRRLQAFCQSRSR